MQADPSRMVSNRLTRQNSPELRSDTCTVRPSASCDPPVQNFCSSLASHRVAHRLPRGRELQLNSAGLQLSLGRISHAARIVIDSEAEIGEAANDQQVDAPTDPDRQP